MPQNFITRVIDPKEQQSVFDNLLKYAVAPRPICFASTIDGQGNINLSPFSYFTIASQQPPICVFSPLRRMRDGSTKHTLDNINEVAEVVINIVNYDMVQQQSLASTEYAKGINEFEKSGFTALPSELVRPPRVAESPIQLECKVNKIVALSDSPGAGNLVLAEVVRMHVHHHLLNDKNQVDQASLDLVARLGGDWYCRVSADNLFEVPKPLRNLGIGVDQLPEHIRFSKILTGNHLGLLANVEVIPEREPDSAISDPIVQQILNEYLNDKEQLSLQLHQYAVQLLDRGELVYAWQVLFLSQ